jgi:biofilm PGA synthesis N-glycosyltransferase PgaC
MKSHLTVIIPAYNEAESIADTVRSIQNQTLVPDEIIVVDDCSTDGTGDIARACGVTVLCPPHNTGSKAGAQNFALRQVETEFTMAIDADTILAPDAIELLLRALDKSTVVAACGFVLPRFVNTLWEKGRYLEYLLAFSWYKPIQDYYDKPLISSGCFSAYRTQVLRKVGGWSTRTMAEDMDLTWTFYQQGHEVRFVPKAMCYPIEPHNFDFMRKQLRRWSHGFIQNVMLHWRENLRVPYLRHIVNVALWDAMVASLVYLIVVPLLAIFFMQPLFLLAYVIDLPAIVIPALFTREGRKHFWRVITSVPAFLVLRTVNGYFIINAIWHEWFLRQPLKVYEKGH